MIRYQCTQPPPRMFVPADADRLVTADGQIFCGNGRASLLYPMDLRKITLGETVIYDKTVPGPPWFLLEIDVGKSFVPVDAERFITADDQVLHCQSRIKSRRGV